MSTRLARLALSLYPLAYRRRYGDEMRALLEDCRPGPRGLFDLMRGAVVAHLRPAAGLSEGVEADTRVRLGLAGMLACWVLFAVAGFAFYSTSEDYSFVAAGTAHPWLGGAYVAIQVLAVLASLAVIAGALPLACVALWQARRQRGPLRLIVGIALAAVIAFMLATSALIALAHSSLATGPHPSSGIAQGAFTAWGIVGLLCGGACVVAARAALLRIGVARVWLTVALRFATFVVAAMIAMTCATALYSIALVLDAPRLAGEGNGPYQLVSVGASLIIVTVAMALFAAIAATSAARVWRRAS